MQLGEDWTMEVTDEVGQVILTLDFHVAAPAATTASNGVWDARA